MKKKQRKTHSGGRGTKIFICLIALLCLWYLYTADQIFRNTVLYRPTVQMQYLIRANALRAGISPELLQAVILTESKYNPDAVSRTGALGVMQIMPETANWIAQESGLPADHLKSTDENMALGSWYLYYLIDKYDGNLVLALAAYNAGRGNVDEWIRQNHWTPGFSDIDRIPYAETREFVRSVLHYMAELKEEQ